jgi:NitT/TauT family transport system substrate-binding protein
MEWQGRRGRRWVALIAAAVLAVMALGVAACGGDDSSSGGSTGGNSASAGGPEKTTLKVGILKIADVYPLWVAQQQGYFKQAGFKNVQVVEMAGGAAIQPAIQSGQLDLGWSNVVSVVLAHARKFDFQFFDGGTYIGPGAERNQVILVKKNSPIHSVKQLAGKRYGVNTLGNIAELSARAYMRENGVDDKKVKLVELGTPLTVPPLVQGRVDAVSANEPAVTIGLATGKVRILAENPYSVFGRNVFLAGWMSTKKFIDDNPRTIQAFTQAIHKAVAWAKQHKEETNRLISQNTGIAPNVADKQVPSITKNTITPGDIQPWIEAAKKYGLMDTTFGPGEVLWQGQAG